MRNKNIPTREEFHRRYAPTIRECDFDTYNPPPVGGRHPRYYTFEELRTRAQQYIYKKGGEGYNYGC